MIKFVSNKRAAQHRIYRRERKKFLAVHPWCGARITHTSGRVMAVEVHHIRGKVGRLLNLQSFWMAVCAECHDWIHLAHPAEAQRLGLLASGKDWNVYPKD